MVKKVFILFFVMVFFRSNQNSMAENIIPKNLMENSGFELDAVGTQGKIPAEWAKYYCEKKPLEIVKLSRPGSKGVKCLKINTDINNKRSGVYSKRIPLDSSLNLNISLWLKDGSNANIKRLPYVGVAWYDLNGNPVNVQNNVNYTYINFEKKSNWQAIKQTFIPYNKDEKDGTRRYYSIPDNVASCELRIFVTNYPYQVWVDDVMITQTKPKKISSESKIKLWQISYKGEENGDANYKVTHAAKELCEYLKKVTGKKIIPVTWEKANAKIIFLITEAKYVPEEISRTLIGKNQDAFLIKYPYILNDKKVCLLVSQDNRAYDFPVYYFLRKYMGVDWVGPGESGKVIPENPDWNMPEQINILENPDFAMRLWYDGKFLTSLPNFAMARPLLVGNQRMDFHHAFGKIFNPEKYAESDPDIYPLINGKRFIPSKDNVLNGITSGWQPCLGNPKTQDIAVKWVLEQYKKNPGLMSVSLSVNDGDSNHCTCPLCQAMDIKDAFKNPRIPQLSDRYFRFYNKVIEQVLKVKPDAYIAVLAYGPTTNPPVKTKINDHIIVFLAGGSPTRFRSAGGKVSLYQWHLDNAYPTIRHYPHLLADYLREAHKIGAIGYYAQIEHNWAAGGPKTYVLSHLLWNVNSNVNLLLDKYMMRAFGKNAGVHMRAYFDRWEKIWQREEGKLNNKYALIEEWGNVMRKFKYVSWDDIYFMDKAIEAGRNSKMTTSERKRFYYFDIFYKWTRTNLSQYLMTKDFLDKEWLNSQPLNKILENAKQAQDLTETSNRIWKENIAPDRTGWLLNQSYRLIKEVEKGKRKYDSLMVEQIRNTIEAYLPKGIEYAFSFASDNKLKTQNKENIIAFWNKQFAKYPSLTYFIEREIDRYIASLYSKENLFIGGVFEVGKTGELSKGKIPFGWKKGYIDLGSIQITKESRPDSSGKKCLRIEKGSENSHPQRGIISKLIPFNPKLKLTISGWIQASGKIGGNAGAYFGVGWYDSNKKPINRKKVNINYMYITSYRGNEWRKFKQTFTLGKKEENYSDSKIPFNTAFFDIRIFVNNYPKPVWYDDIIVTQSPAE